MSVTCSITNNFYGLAGTGLVLDVDGAPYLAPVIEHFKQLARYSKAELQAAVVSAALAIFVKMDTDAF